MRVKAEKINVFVGFWTREMLRSQGLEKTPCLSTQGVS
jgi:hypothetical protein